MRIVRKLLVTLIALSLSVSMLYITAEAGNIAYGAATIKATSLNVRSGPGTDNTVVGTVQNGDIVVILEKTSSDWYHINYRGIDGYVMSTYLDNVLLAENFTAIGRVNGDDLLMRSGPSTSNSVVGSFNYGDIVNLIGINNGWYKLKCGSDTGYVRSDYITIVSDQAQVETAVEAASSADDHIVTQLSSEQATAGQQLVTYAMQYVGLEYVYGGTSPSRGFDCSGLVYHVFRHYGYNITRTASNQYAYDGVNISKSDLIPGDLVFFSSNGGYSVTHVGIYIGNNEFVHASTPRTGVVVSSLDSDYYMRVWYGAKRVLF